MYKCPGKQGSRVEKVHRDVRPGPDVTLSLYLLAGADVTSTAAGVLCRLLDALNDINDPYVHPSPTVRGLLVTSADATSADANARWRRTSAQFSEPVTAVALARTHAAALRLLVERGAVVNAYVGSLNEVPGMELIQPKRCEFGFSQLRQPACSLFMMATVCACLARAASEEERQSRQLSVERRRQVAATTEAVRILSGADGIDVNASDIGGRTALMIAVAAEHLEVVQLILSSGCGPGNRGMRADSNRQACRGSIALTHAVDARRPDIVKVLLDAEADPNQRDSRGRTALMSALEQEAPSLDIVRALLSAGTDPNAQDNGGKTALMAAAVRNDAETIRLLMAAGADPQLADGQHQTAFDTFRPDWDGVSVVEHDFSTEEKNCADYLAQVSPVVINTSAVVAALVATLSYTSLLSPPGGWSGGIGAPAATSRSFVVFMLLLPVALYSSLASLFILLSLHLVQYTWSTDPARVFEVVKIFVRAREVHEYNLIGRMLFWALILLLVAIAALLGAGIAAYFVVFTRPHQVYVPILAVVLAGVAILITAHLRLQDVLF